MALCTACACCGAGVRRAHIVDASVDGCLLLELYSAEGAANATMISNDFYQVFLMHPFSAKSPFPMRYHKPRMVLTLWSNILEEKQAYCAGLDRCLAFCLMQYRECPQSNNLSY